MADADPPGPMTARPVTGPLRTVDLIRQRAVEAVLGQAGLNHPGLVAEIRRRFGSVDVAAGALVREPVIEGAAPFRTGDRVFGDLAGTLLHADVIRAIGSEGAGDYRFPPDARPYLHQIEAWEHLTSAERRSVLVSSGTGSGKTECFLMPLLHDLATEAATAGRLSGVRALALYPLNALIASQEERLKAWTAPFAGRIRFGLYNGMTPERLRAGDRPGPEQVADRVTLRADPPPILVTNVTMLEYLTVRRVDRPLIANSRGMLRWIILDEAHSYVGSAAAEIALLIRRVLLAFGVSAEQVRFVATSATIGDGRDVTDDLRRFLRDLSGADESRVEVVIGDREPVALPPVALLTVGASSPLSPDALADPVAVARHPAVQAFVRAAEERPVRWDEARALLEPTGAAPEAVIGAIAASTPARAPLLPMRVHGFIRAVPGLWSCLDPSCRDAPADWPFGAVAAERVDECPACRAPVLEVMSCRECGEPYLDAEERGGRLAGRVTPPDLDEFAALRDRDAAGDEDDQAAREQLPGGVRLAVATRPLDGGRPLHVEPATGRVHDRAAEETRRLTAHDPERCGACGAESGTTGAALRPFRFGAPFLIGNAAPVLLDGMPPGIPDGLSAFRPPAEGRQILSFTDSRQGTARFAATLQTNAERGFVRAFVYHAVQGSMVAGDEGDPAVAELRRGIADLEPLAHVAPQIADEVARKRAALAARLTPSIAGIAWPDLRDRLAAAPEVAHWMKQVWGYRDDRFRANPAVFAEFLLLREFARRPRRANTAETMGLARLRFDAVDRVAERDVPDLLVARGKGVADWRGVLATLVDGVARANLAVRANDADLHWVTARGRRKLLLPPGEAAQATRELRWPSVGGTGLPGNVALILEKTLGLDRSDGRDRAALNELFAAAWDRLLPLFAAPGQNGYALDYARVRIAPVVEAWACPVTHRVLPETALGLSPYGHREGLRTADLPAQPLRFPALPVSFPRGMEVERVRDWLAADPLVAELRDRGIWTDLFDRAALLSPYLRAAEHSAQQPAGRLRRFEREFKAGEINILNCSTTMEMGVDIGSVSAVMMTNVPPALANYRQRVGRAGRRRQGFASALTYTRDTPLDREAFRDPQAYLARRTRAPSVKLDSRRIVQRHVNALLLARWFAGEGGEAMKTRAGDFFGCPEAAEAPRAADTPVARCRAWMEAPGTAETLGGEVEQLVRGTILGGDRDLFAAAARAVTKAENGFVAEWEALGAQVAGADALAGAGVGYQLQRLTRENLLKELAVRSVLPGHGFPTDVVQFVNRDEPARDEAIGGDDAGRRRRSFPTRNLDIAIRDYAPGAEVVVDGLVYRSAGVTLNWLRPADDAKAREIQSLKTFWTCASCGAADCAHAAPDRCPSCRAPVPQAARRRFLEPAGFTADMAEAPHADTDQVGYVEPEPEQIVARGAAWTPCADPAQGRLRASHDGLVFYSSRGSGRAGYSVCLECGRAEPAGDDGDRPLAGHRPLRGTARDADGLCPGNGKPFKILSSLALGHETITDVAELQPTGLETEGAAWAAVSALREALARQLGVEAGEMGMSVRRARTPLGGTTHSLFLFDRNAGGAGFAPQAVTLYEALLADAEAILRCGQPGCATGCSNCVLTADLYRQAEIIDRRAALDWIVETRRALTELPEEDRVIPEARFARATADEIAAAVDRGARRVTIWADGSLDVAALTGGGFERLARRIADRGAMLTLVVQPAWLAALDPAARLALRDAAQARPFALRQGAAPRYGNGAVALAAVEGAAGSDQSATIWASRDAAAATLGGGWGRAAAAPVVRFAQATIPLAAAVDLATLLPRSGTRYLEIGDELDGTVLGFGERLVAHLLPAIRQAAPTSPGSLTEIVYTDRYLQTPLAVRLMADTVAALRDALAAPGTAVPVTVVTNPLRPNDRQPFAPDHDWQWDEDRRAVLAALAGGHGLAVDLIERGAEHGRVMTLAFAGGGRVRLVLDQGFGPWRTPRFARFDFGADGATQARKLAALSAMMTARGNGYVVVTGETGRTG